jgi:mannose-6-phosphate isomerase-like protein (cupin superfamily)
MTLLTRPGDGPAFPYAGQPVHILAGQDGLPPGFAAMELTIPGHFAGPIPHAHDEFDEAIYVLSGRLLVAGDDAPQEAPPGSMFVAPRGHRHGFSNPSAQDAQVLGIWAPPEPALAFMRDIGAVLTPGTPAAFCPDGNSPIRSAVRVTPCTRQMSALPRAITSG